MVNKDLAKCAKNIFFCTVPLHSYLYSNVADWTILCFHESHDFRYVG